MGDTCWDQIDAMKKSGDELLERLRRRRNGWKMKDPKPNGTMVAERAEKKAFQYDDADKEMKEVVVRASAVVTGMTHAEVWANVVTADGLCSTCFHKLDTCGEKGCNAKMRHLPKVAVKVTVRGKVKTKHVVATCGCRANAKEEVSP